jgi:hypothetical protein
MDENKHLNKFIGYAVLAILAYYLLQFVIQYLIYGVIGLVVWRVYIEHLKRKK